MALLLCGILCLLIVLLALTLHFLSLTQARTLTVLERLDPGRKTEVMRFLVAAVGSGC